MTRLWAFKSPPNTHQILFAITFINLRLEKLSVPKSSKFEMQDRGFKIIVSSVSLLTLQLNKARKVIPIYSAVLV